MRVYNPRDWFSLLLKPHQTSSFHLMAWLILAVCIFTIIIVYIEQDVLKLPQDHPVKNVLMLQTFLGFAISILLVFRTNTAYDRWWEGRKLWGSLVNSSRNLAIKINAMIPSSEADRDFYRQTIPLFAEHLKAHLLKEKTRLMLDDLSHPEIDIDDSKHVPNQIAKLIFQKTYDLYKTGSLSADDMRLINIELSNFADICGACERIKNTPIPYSYSAFIKKVVFFYIATMPVGLSFTLGYWCVPIVALVFYTMLGMELVAEEIEDPFSGDENDIPMDKIADNIRVHVAEILA
ncbi:MAG: bestrophin family protein [Chitinophagales bacterium]|nr:bestrophin family protein [Chitinophagales bacterium]